ncbi:transcriptional regulator domain-containing protein [Phenylobacterium sp.]|uniref:transcriptional regulator domain-containing protein n=1 Tax=Phenylobacterium sp. TaxID=1871053 RepID=UPI0035269DAE
MPRAAYLYLLALDGAGLAWEYLRRDPAYRASWRRDPAARWRLRCPRGPQPRRPRRGARLGT